MNKTKFRAILSSYSFLIVFNHQGSIGVRVFFCGEFSPLGDKKKGGTANPTKGFFKIKKKIRHVMRKKKKKLLDLKSVFH